MLQDDLTSSGFAGEGAAVSPLGVDFEESTEDVLVPMPHKRGSGMAWAVAVVGLAVVGLAAVLLLRNNEQAPVAAGIVFEGQLSPDNGEVETTRPAAARVPLVSQDAGAENGTPPDAASTPAIAKADARQSRKAGPKVHRCESKSSAEAKNRCYVTAQGRKLTKCLRDHAAEISGTPQMMLDFDLDARGNVVGVAVSPPQFASTTLGACVKSVAGKIRFGPQHGAVHFRIPLKINQK
ncbi:MAG: hypothetical protein GY811_27615 [Myxococcales bacterium]|nr:hypothetical protein [Myxococcales bacterium]